MFKPLLVGTAVLFMLAEPVVAKQSDPSVIGTWILDTSRLPMPPGQRPKSVTFTVADAGSDKLAMAVRIIAPDGATVDTEGTYSTDGTPGRPTNVTEADTAVINRPAASVLVMALSKQGQGMSTRVYVVTGGGATMTETVVYYPGDAAPFTRTNYFRRVR